VTLHVASPLESWSEWDILISEFWGRGPPLRLGDWSVGAGRFLGDILSLDERLVGGDAGVVLGLVGIAVVGGRGSEEGIRGGVGRAPGNKAATRLESC
jgi:hypothetical protein